MTTLAPDQVVTLDQLPCSPAEYLQRIKAWSDAALEFDRLQWRELAARSAVRGL